jgi:hypothetical protein
MYDEHADIATRPHQQGRVLPALSAALPSQTATDVYTGRENAARIQQAQEDAVKRGKNA